jgi:hypothetical protein
VVGYGRTYSDPSAAITSGATFELNPIASELELESPFWAALKWQLGTLAILLLLNIGSWLDSSKKRLTPRVIYGVAQWLVPLGHLEAAVAVLSQSGPQFIAMAWDAPEFEPVRELDSFQALFEKRV